MLQRMGLTLSIAFLSILLVTNVTLASTEGHWPWEQVFAQEGLASTDSDYTEFVGVSYGNDVYVVVSNKQNGNGVLLTSTDGRSWKTHNPWNNVTFKGIEFINGQFYAYGNWQDMDESFTPCYCSIWRSPDGCDWATSFSEAIPAAQRWVQSLAYGNGVFVASISGRLYFSTDNLHTLTEEAEFVPYEHRDVAYGNGVFIAVGGSMRYSQDGQIWSTVDQDVYESVSFVNGRFVRGSEKTMGISVDGVNWQDLFHGQGTSIAYGNSGYVIPNGIFSKPHTDMLYSTDLENQDFARIFSRNLGFEEQSSLKDIAAGAGGFVVVGGPNIFYCSFANMELFPKILGDNIIHLQIDVPFEYTVATANFNPDRLGVTGYARKPGGFEMLGADLPPGISLKTPARATPLSECAPHFAGIPTEEGEWTVTLFAYENEYGYDSTSDGLYVKKSVTFKVGPATIGQYSLNLAASPAAGGTVGGGGTYNSGEQATITATPSDGYQFVKWTKNGEQMSTDKTYMVTVTEDATITAIFTLCEDVTDLTPTSGPANVGKNKIWTIEFNQPLAHHCISAETFKVLGLNGKEIASERGYFDIEPNPYKMQVKPPASGYEPGEYTLRISGVVSQSGKELAKPVIMRFTVK